MKRQSGFIPILLAATAILGGTAHADHHPAEGRDEVTFRPWIGTLGVHFPSESLFEEAAFAPFPGNRGGAGDLSGQTSAAGLQGLGLGGEWRPFRNGFRLNVAMYLDSVKPDEPAGLRPRRAPEGGSAPDDLVSLGGLEAVPYVGLGWQTNGEGLDVNLDVGAFLSEEYSPRGDPCLGSEPPLSRCGTASFGNGRGRLSGSFRKFEWYPVVSLGIEYRF